MSNIVWRKTEDELPPDDDLMLIVVDGGVLVGWYDASREQWHLIEGDPILAPSHWALWPEFGGDE